jgi:hypothetical protein
MSRKIRRIPVTINTKGIKALNFNEIKIILRAADDLIMSGGRTLLAKILKGSKEKKIYELELEKNPVYAYFKDNSLDDIKAKIDWLIENRYLAVEYDYRLPLLVYTPKGWEIEKDTYSDELLSGFDQMLESGTNLFLMNYLKDRNREMIMLLLDKVESTKNSKYIPILKAWENIDYKKVQKRIRSVIRKLENNQTVTY